MGVVYVAYDERLDRRVAVKRVLAEGVDPKRRARLRREARMAAQFAHPAIVQVFDLIEEEDGDWIVMEFVEGVPLAERLREGPLDVDVALEYGRQIAEGLAAAHALGIVHRDLKTENVMVLPDGRVKILDFGLAKQFDSLRSEEDPALSVTGQVLGTGRAMSPEQARGVEVGPRSDLFSFGVLFYEVLTGVSPFRGETFVDTLGRVVTHQQPPVVDLVVGAPPQLSGLIDRLLNKASELRPESAQVVAEELGHLLGERRFQERLGSGSDAGRQPEAFDAGATEIATGAVFVSDAEGSAIPRGAGPEARKAGRLRPLVAAVAALVVVLTLVAFRFGFSGSPSEEMGSAVASAESHPTDPLALYEEGMRATRRPDQPESINRAVAIFQQLLTLDGDSAAAHAGLARAYWQKARNTSEDPVFADQALAVAREAVRLDPYLADSRVSLGLVEWLQGRPTEARQEFEAALELEPRSSDAHFGLGKLTQSLGHLEEAEVHYRRALELRPTAMYSDALGVLFYAAGRYNEAEESFRHSLELAPNNIYALRNLATLLYAQGRIDEAASKLQEALKIRPDASLYSNLGTIFFYRGLYAKAAAAFEDALEVEGGSNSPFFWSNLADAYRQLPGKEEATRTTYRRAIQLFDAAVLAAPADVRMLSRLALAQARAGQRDQALAGIARIRELGVGEDVYSRYRLALVEELCGEREHALRSLEMALRAGLDLSEVRHEPDLLDLRADLRFHHLLMALEEGE